MRIIGGKYRGRKLPPLTKGNLRPTTDFAREALMNILIHQYDFLQSNLLDLFAGTGAMSFEFLSRGIASSIAVEKNGLHVNYINQVKKLLNETQLQVLQSDVFSYLKSCSNTYNIIFADPPYQLEKLKEIPDIIKTKNILAINGILIVEHGDDVSFETHLFLKEQRKYGAVNFSFFNFD